MLTEQLGFDQSSHQSMWRNQIPEGKYWRNPKSLQAFLIYKCLFTTQTLHVCSRINWQHSQFAQGKHSAIHLHIARVHQNICWIFQIFCKFLSNFLMNATELGKLSKLSHTYLNVQHHPSNTRATIKQENPFNEQAMRFYSAEEGSVWQLSLAGTVQSTYLSHFTDRATCKVTQKHSVKDTLNSKHQWQQTELVFSLNKWQCRVEWGNTGCFPTTVITKPMCAGQERGQSFIFSASKETQIHKTLSIDRWALQSSCCGKRIGRTTTFVLVVLMRPHKNQSQMSWLKQGGKGQEENWINSTEGDGQHPQHAINIILARRKNIIPFPFKCTVATDNSPLPRRSKI